MKFSNDTRSKIAKEIMYGLKLQDIQKLHRVKITQTDIHEIQKKSILCKYRIIKGIKFRFCTSCDQLKKYNPEFFGKDKSTQSNLSVFCKSCIKQKAKNYRIINGDEVRKYHNEYNKQYNKDNPEFAKKENEKRLIGNLTPEKAEIRRGQWNKSGSKRKEKRYNKLIQKAEDLRKT